MTLSRLERTLGLAVRGPLLKPDGEQGGGGNDSGKNDANSGDNGGKSEAEAKDGDGKESKVEFSEEQQRHIGKLLSAERKAAADKARADAKAEADAAATQAQKDKDAADLKAKGEFEAVETQIKADLKTAQDESTALRGENDQFREAMKSGIETGWKELPESVRKIGEKSHPEDDVLGRWTFLNDPDTKALVKDLTDKADPKRGNGVDPKGNGNGTVNKEEAQKAQAPLYRRF